jgi:hypothetical protein
MEPGLMILIMNILDGRVSSLMSTVGTEDAILFIPLPIVNIKYKL